MEPSKLNQLKKILDNEALMKRETAHGETAVYFNLDTLHVFLHSYQSQVSESICVSTRAVDGADGGCAEIFGGSDVQDEWGSLAATGQHSYKQPQRHPRE